MFTVILGINQDCNANGVLLRMTVQCTVDVIIQGLQSSRDSPNNR